jgi:hypothetical protein
MRSLHLSCLDSLILGTAVVTRKRGSASSRPPGACSCAKTFMLYFAVAMERPAWRGLRDFPRRPPKARFPPEIGIGGRLATPPLPHHRAYGSVPRRFDRVRLGRAHRVGEGLGTRNSCCVWLVGPPGVRTCARARLVNHLRPRRQTWLRHDGVTPRSGFAWFATAAKDINAIFDGSTLRGS